jgi:hypothetical protein
MARDRYKAQVELLVRAIPIVAEEPDFALKGGTAINLFYRDMPRLSVDIDLTYVPIDDRAIALNKIDEAFDRMVATAGRTLRGVDAQRPPAAAMGTHASCFEPELRKSKSRSLRSPGERSYRREPCASRMPLKSTSVLLKCRWSPLRISTPESLLRRSIASIPATYMMWSCSTNTKASRTICSEHSSSTPHVHRARFTS